ncbi:MAG: Coenzyme F420 hydrogenase/dehydrogenase, beta subunit C-terminal domain [Clostridiales bacterium]|jgi:coenzyme F420-reducing hydrogenase beta subunit|nr:Coenzyme F420 hydrogenase/dehydrogenase, beta subunit C-terminal domain [Clostridiales bacterium]
MDIVYENKQSCCGCGLCAAVCPKKCIQLIDDKTGFPYPVIDQTVCIDCGKCGKSCIIKNGYEYFTETPDFYAVKHKNKDIVMSSTSGGIFTAVSDYILAQDGVVFGAMLDENLNPVYSYAETQKDRDRFRGSKYVKCSSAGLFENVEIFLKSGRKVLVTGTPCQVSAVRKFAKDHPGLLTMDFICHGTPSAKFFKDYICYAQSRCRKKIVRHHFRYKSSDVMWSHTEANILADGTVDSFSYISQLCKNLFYANANLNPSCYTCGYTNPRRPGDITMADYWGIEMVMPDFADKRGTSLLLVNSSKGRDIFEAIKSELEYKSSNLAEATAGHQKHLLKPNDPNPRYAEFQQDYIERGFEYCAKKFAPLTWKDVVKSVLGETIVRRIKSRLYRATI